jgi:hypothetical protein
MEAMDAARKTISRNLNRSVKLLGPARQISPDVPKAFERPMASGKSRLMHRAIRISRLTAKFI